MSIQQAHAAYSGLVPDLRRMGYTSAQIRGHIAAYLVVLHNLSRIVAHAAARNIVGA